MLPPVPETPEPNHVVGKQKLLRIHVPTPRTHLLLGREWYEPDQSAARTRGPLGFGYPGISAATDENLFLDIGKHSLLQSKGGMFLQTQEAFLQASQKQMSLCTPAGMYLTGGDLFLGGGDLFDAPKMLKTLGKAIDPQLLAVPTLNEFRECGDSAWNLYFKYFIPGLSLLKTPLMMTSPSDIEGSLKFLVSLGQFLWKVGEQFVPPSEKPSVEIFGARGILQLSPESISLVSHDRIGLNGISGISLNALRGISAQSLEGVSLFGGAKAALESALWADVKAGATVGVSSLKGAVKVRGKKLSFGGLKNKVQTATEEVQIHAPEGKGIIEQLAKEEVTLKVGPIAEKLSGPIHTDVKDPNDTKSDEELLKNFKKDSRNSSARDLLGPAPSASIPSPSASIELKAKDESISVKAAKKVTINVGKFSVVIGTDELTIGFNAHQKKRGASPVLRITEEEIILNTDSNGAQFCLDSNGLVAWGGKHSSLELVKGGAYINGKTIKLG